MSADKYLVLSVDRYEFTDERTKELKSGATVWAINDYREDTAESAGFKPSKMSIVEELFKTFRAADLPAFFDVSFTLRPGKDNKPTATISGAKLVKSVPLFDKVKA